jgi:hypothetical protein
MRLFQLIAVPFIAAMVAVSLRGLLRARGRLAASLFWTLLWTAAGVAVLVPDATTQVARSLGIQRGADLVIYCAILGFTVGFYFVYVRLRQLTREITVLTRELAIRDAQPPAPPPSGRAERGA